MPAPSTVAVILVSSGSDRASTRHGRDDRCGGPEARYLAAARSDLRNLVTAEEGYFADSVRYSASLKQIGYAPTAGVTIKVELLADGWNATATIAQAPG